MQLANKISAATISVASRASGADAVSVTGAQLTTQNLTLAGGTTGGVTLAGGVLSAGGVLALSGPTLADAETTSSLTDNNKRAGAGGLTLTFTGAAQIGAVKLMAAAAI